MERQQRMLLIVINAGIGYSPGKRLVVVLKGFIHQLTDRKTIVNNC